ncbi:MAG TPA: ATP-binding cassette domain-containing protein [Acidimicrobiales bacterium]|nr:ATP-binding cassette domain-containing protein [Acidimicrobiales bacterium]
MTALEDTAAGPSGSVALLEARAIKRSYGSVVALNGVDLEVRAGEVLGLVGDNGAGKSTLVKILSGAVQPSSGALLVDGQPVVFHSPKDSRQRGIEVVYQDLALATELSVSENVFLGREYRRSGLLGRLRVIDRRKMASEAERTLESLAIEIHSVTARCGLLSGGQRQAVAVARAVMWGSKVLLLDEPTAALAVAESEKIAALVGEVARRGVGVVLVSHNMPQVHELCDRVVVLLRGRVVADLPRQGRSVEDIVMWITGAALARDQT